MSLAKKKGKSISDGRANIKASFNNIIVTISDLSGATLCWASSGSEGFKGPKKSTPHTAQVVAQRAAAKAKEFGIKRIYAILEGPGAGREAALKGLNSMGISVNTLSYNVKLPHNGCRPPKKRRV